MAAEAAALLDQLMGATRNANPGDDLKQPEWWDSEVCKHYLCGFCPSELFTNTKSDVGPCYKIHNEKLKKAYEESDQRCTKGYEEEFLHYLEKVIRDLDRRISRGKERLQKSAEAKQKLIAPDLSNEKLKSLHMEINANVMELERLGAMGQVEEAQAVMRRVEELEKERERERMAVASDSTKTLAGFDVDNNDFHEKMEQCDICGSFLVIGDTQSRVDSHLLGKQHIGFARIRAAIGELKKIIQDHHSQRRRQLDDPQPRRRSQDRERERERERGRAQRGRRSRSRSRDRRHSWRSRSRSRERRRSWRSRSRSRERRRGRRSRSRSRERERERRRGRSRSRERRSPERSKKERRGSSPRRDRSRNQDHNPKKDHQAKSPKQPSAERKAPSPENGRPPREPREEGEVD